MLSYTKGMMKIIIKIIIKLNQICLNVIEMTAWNIATALYLLNHIF